jgi:hypothetical protein
VDLLHERHRAQVTNYLLLTELAHAKLINMRPEVVQHEFVNTNISLADRTSFQIDDRAWDACDQKTEDLKRWLTALLHDIGVGLDLEIYDQAAIHFLGGEEAAIKEINVSLDARKLGRQKMICPVVGSVLKITALPERNIAAYEEHLRRFLGHVALERLHWINIGRSLVGFRTLTRTTRTEKWGTEK